MIPLLPAQASGQWACLVKALLHTLWMGGLAAAALLLVLRGKTEPALRYRWCVGALAAVVFGGIFAWAVLQPRPNTPSLPMSATPAAVSPLPDSATAPSPAVVATSTGATTERAGDVPWTTWLAFLWLTGVAVMLSRAGWVVAGAENLRRSSRPLEDEALLKLIEEARRQLGLARRIQVVVTEKLTSPAVLGVLTPALVLPLSLVTTLPPEQIQMIVLHELAHIRRGDYLINLCQLLAESLLFFNPAVWWISRQIRQEREACCDAVAIALAGERLQYARTLAEVAGTALAAAPAFGDRRNPSGLKDRILRLLVPGYRPALRLTWRASLAVLLVGGGFLFLSALGTRITLAAVLSPRQRIERIEKKMVQINVAETISTVSFSGHVITADGSPMPEWIYLNVVARTGNNSSVTSWPVHRGEFSNSATGGTIYLGLASTNFAPVCLGPFGGSPTNRYENLLIVLQPGYDAVLQLVDAEDGRPVPDARVNTMFWMQNSGFPPQYWRSGPDGAITLTHCADFPVDISVNVPGYEFATRRFDHVVQGQPLRWELLRGLPLVGQVLDKTSSQPIHGVEIRILHQERFRDNDSWSWNRGWDGEFQILGRTDSDGRFDLRQFGKDSRYLIGFIAMGQAPFILPVTPDGATNLTVRLGPEMVIRGRVLGSLDVIPRNGRTRGLSYNVNGNFGFTSMGDSGWSPIREEDGVLNFAFTNRVPGLIHLTVGGRSFERMVDSSVDDWVVDLTQAPEPPPAAPAKRDVIFRFQGDSGVSPRGTVEVEIPDNIEVGHLTSHFEQREITNGQISVPIAIGGRTSINPKHMVGFWFNRAGVNGNLFSIVVTNGPGAMMIDIPLIPAGAIYAKVLNTDGSPAGNVFYGVSELKRAPGRDTSVTLDSGDDGFHDGQPRRWASGPLPLGGTYQVYAWRGNSFTVSGHIRLTEASPDADVTLQFTPGRNFDGVVLDAEGRPLRGTAMKLLFTLKNEHGFGLSPVATDAQGHFHIENTTPELGAYTLQAEFPGLRAESLKLNFSSQPQTFHLQPGRTLAGRVIESGTGFPIPKVEVRALDFTHENFPMLSTQTADDGRFQFTSLSDVKYTFYVNEGQIIPEMEHRADGSTNLELRVKLYPWSTVKHGAPEARK